jgi:CBS domain-containing protein
MSTIDTGTRPRRDGLTTVRVADAMHPGVFVCSHQTPLRDVARMMAENRVHCIVARDQKQELWGVVSDLDLVSAASVLDIEERIAGETAATPVLMVAPDETLERAAQLMVEHAVTHLVVVDPHDGRPLGVLSTLDVAKALAAAPGR